jgi:poly(A) polymerase/tRNA nucleotidyltransferase (CCA-adding enzyme)
LQELMAALLHETTPVYVVGGVVRDLLLGRRCQLNDIDLVLEAPAQGVARRIADQLGWSFYPIDEGRDVARLIFPPRNDRELLVCDISGMRGGSIEADLQSRDFTVNALALALSGGKQPELIDVCGGQRDLAQRLLRRVSPVSLAEDAVRLVRAVRLRAQFSFTLDDATQVQIERLASSVRLAAPERLRDELWKSLATPAPHFAVRDLHTLGLLPHLLPEVAATLGVDQSFPHPQDVFAHTVKTVEEAALLRDWVLGHRRNAAGDAHAQMFASLEPWRFRLRHLLGAEISTGRLRAEWLVWHALFHNIGKPATRMVEIAPDATTPMRIRFPQHERVGVELAGQRLDQLRFSRIEIALAETVLGHYVRPQWLHTSFPGRSLSRRACYRFFRDAGGRQFDYRAGVDALLLALADYLATYADSLPSDWPAYLAHMRELLAFAFDEHSRRGMHAKPLVNGDQLMQHFRLPPGRQIGYFLDRLMEAQVAGEITTTEEALRLVSGWVHDQGV